MGVSTSRRVGQVARGLGALVVLVALLVGAPIALLAFAGNPLPDHLPSFAETGATLTSRDDGQLFLRALALVGWVGWATVGLSVLVELPARLSHRTAPRLPGLRRQQRMAAALVGAAALVVVASPAAAAVAVMTPPVVAAAAPPTAGASFASQPLAFAGPGPPPHTSVRTTEPAYEVERGDYLGHIADRYLGDFDSYPELATLNGIRDPHATGVVVMPGGEAPTPARPGRAAPRPAPPAQRPAPRPAPPAQRPAPQPARPTDGPSAPSTPDRSDRPPAGDTAARPAPARSTPARPVPPRGAPDPAPQDPGAGARTPVRAADSPNPAVPRTDGEPQDHHHDAGGAADGGANSLNRPLAISAVLAAASIAGAQAGAILGLRKRSAPGSSARSNGRVGRHRADVE
jgi:hypothetical protein